MTMLGIILLGMIFPVITKRPQTEKVVTNPEIKKVWIHGSRAKGTSLPGSDLDLIIDCEYSAWEKIQKNTEELLIPYFIDITNLNDPERSNFLKTVYLEAKKIYDKKDFQIFWDDNKSLNSASIKIDISKII